MSGAVRLRHFVAAAQGHWRASEALSVALSELRRDLGLKKPAELAACRVFASDERLVIESDVYLRVSSQPGAVLVEFGAQA